MDISVASDAEPHWLTDGDPQYDCGHFKKTNDWLQQRYGDEGPIDWNLGPKAIDQAEEKDSATMEAHEGVKVDERIEPEDVTASVAEPATGEPAKDEVDGAESEHVTVKETITMAEPAGSSQITATDLITDEELAADLSDVENI